MKAIKYQMVIIFLLVVVFVQQSVSGQEFPVHIGTYFEKDPDSSKKEALDLLANMLIKSPTALGVIVLSTRKKENVGKRCRYIKTYLSEKGVEADRLLFIQGGIAPLRGTHLGIFHKDDKTLKDVKDYCQQ